MVKPSTWLPTDPPENETNDGDREKNRKALLCAAAVSGFYWCSLSPPSATVSVKVELSQPPREP